MNQILGYARFRRQRPPVADTHFRLYRKSAATASSKNRSAPPRDEMLALRSFGHTLVSFPAGDGKLTNASRPGRPTGCRDTCRTC